MLCLKRATDAAWAPLAARDADMVLADHAHCEMKAASNALSLAARHLDRPELARALTDLAREEIEHFQRVLSLLLSRGVVLGLPPVDGYAAELRRRALQQPPRDRAASLVDRLLVGALIEARSCERFKLLAEATAEDPSCAAHHALWRDLLASEARHYRTFLDLAVDAAGSDEGRVLGRLAQLAEIEAAIVGSLARRQAGARRASIHG